MINPFIFISVVLYISACIWECIQGDFRMAMVYAGFAFSNFFLMGVR